MNLLNKIKSDNNFISLPKPITFDYYECIGYYPCSKARAFCGVNTTIVPRQIFSHIENKLRQNNCIGNKILAVFVCDDAPPFAIYFFDNSATMCNLYDIVVL